MNTNALIFILEFIEENPSSFYDFLVDQTDEESAEIISEQIVSDLREEIEDFEVSR